MLRYRLRALGAGDDLNEQFLTSYYLLCGLILLLPGSTTATAKSLTVFNQELGGDVPFGLVLLGVGGWMLASTLRVTSDAMHRGALLTCSALSVGLLLLYAVANPITMGTGISFSVAALAFLSYLRVDRD